MSEEDKIKHDPIPDGKENPQSESYSENDSIFADILGALGVRGSPHKQVNTTPSPKEAEQEANEATPLEEEVRNLPWARQKIPDDFELNTPSEFNELVVCSPDTHRREQPRKRWFIISVMLIAFAGVFNLFMIREPDPPAPDVVATYDGRNITVEELAAFIKQEDLREWSHMVCPVHGYDHAQCDPTEECEKHPIDSLEGYRQMVTRLVMEQMVMDWAEENGMLQREDIRHDMSDLLNDAKVSQYAAQLHDENLSPKSISGWEVQQYYDDNRADYAGKTLDEVEDEIRQILALQKEEDFFSEYIDQLKKTAGLQVDFDVLKVTEPTQKEISAYYEQNRDSYAVPPSITYLEIRISGEDTATRSTDADRKLRSGESFESVAATYADGGKAVEQTIQQDAATTAALRRLVTMNEGAVTDLLSNEDGSYSVFRIKSKTEAGYIPLAQVSKEIYALLLDRNTAEEYEQRKTHTLFSIHSRRYTLGDFYTEFKELSETNQKVYASFEMKQKLVEQIIAQELLLEESSDAANNGEDSHELEELKIQYLSQMLHQEEVDEKLVEPTHEEVRQYYDENIENMVSPSSVQLNLIWIYQGVNGEQKSNAMANAEEALAALKAGTDFATVAKQYSEDTSAEYGGQIFGEFHEEDLDASIANAVFGLNAGEISKIVDISGGYYIFQVRERSEERLLTFEEVSENIKAHLREQQHMELEADMEQTLLDRYGFTIYDKTLRQMMKESGAEEAHN